MGQAGCLVAICWWLPACRCCARSPFTQEETKARVRKLRALPRVSVLTAPGIKLWNDLETRALPLTFMLPSTSWGALSLKATPQTGCTGPARGGWESPALGKELGDQVQGAEKRAGPSSLPELRSNLPVLLLRTLLLPGWQSWDLTRELPTLGPAPPSAHQSRGGWGICKCHQTVAWQRGPQRILVWWRHREASERCHSHWQNVKAPKDRASVKLPSYNLHSNEGNVTNQDPKQEGTQWVTVSWDVYWWDVMQHVSRFWTTGNDKKDIFTCQVKNHHLEMKTLYQSDTIREQ